MKHLEFNSCAVSARGFLRSIRLCVWVHHLCSYLGNFSTWNYMIANSRKDYYLFTHEDYAKSLILPVFSRDNCALTLFV